MYVFTLQHRPIDVGQRVKKKVAWKGLGSPKEEVPLVRLKEVREREARGSPVSEGSFRVRVRN